MAAGSTEGEEVRLESLGEQLVPLLTDHDGKGAGAAVAAPTINRDAMTVRADESEASPVWQRPPCGERRTCDYFEKPKSVVASKKAADLCLLAREPSRQQRYEALRRANPRVSWPKRLSDIFCIAEKAKS